MKSAKDAFEARITSQYQDETPPDYKTLYDEQGVPYMIEMSDSEKNDYSERIRYQNENLVSRVRHDTQERVSDEEWYRNNQMLLAGGCTPEFEERLNGSVQEHDYYQEAYSVWNPDPNKPKRKKEKGMFSWLFG